MRNNYQLISAFSTKINGNISMAGLSLSKVREIFCTNRCSPTRTRDSSMCFSWSRERDYAFSKLRAVITSTTVPALPISLMMPEFSNRLPTLVIWSLETLCDKIITRWSDHCLRQPCLRSHRTGFCRYFTFRPHLLGKPFKFRAHPHSLQ